MQWSPPLHCSLRPLDNAVASPIRQIEHESCDECSLVIVARRVFGDAIAVRVLALRPQLDRAISIAGSSNRHVPFTSGYLPSKLWAIWPIVGHSMISLVSTKTRRLTQVRDSQLEFLEALANSRPIMIPHSTKGLQTQGIANSPRYDSR